MFFQAQTQLLHKLCYQYAFLYVITSEVSAYAIICHLITAVLVTHSYAAIALLLTMAPCQVRGSGAIIRQGTGGHRDIQRSGVRRRDPGLCHYRLGTNSIGMTFVKILESLCQYFKPKSPKKSQ